MYIYLDVTKEEQAFCLVITALVLSWLVEHALPAIHRRFNKCKEGQHDYYICNVWDWERVARVAYKQEKPLVYHVGIIELRCGKCSNSRKSVQAMRGG
jgi:hypothetical protein